MRVVPPGVARYGSFLSEGVVLMPGFVNIGAWVGPRTMVDTWATVGSCAQIGADVHLSGGVGIGGVLEPPQARPVIVEDGAFLGSRAVVVEGVVVGEGAVIAPNVVLSASIPVIDVTGSEPVEHRGYVPPRAVVLPGYAAEGVSRRDVRAPVRADRRRAQRLDRPQDLAQRRSPGVRDRTEASSRSRFTDDVALEFYALLAHPDAEWPGAASRGRAKLLVHERRRIDGPPNEDHFASVETRRRATLARGLASSRAARLPWGRSAYLATRTAPRRARPG